METTHGFSPDSSDPTADAPSDKGSINKVIATATTMYVYFRCKLKLLEEDTAGLIKVYQNSA